MDLNALLERRARNWDAMKKLLDDASADKRELSGEESQTYDRLESEVDTDTKAIERHQRHAERGKSFDRVEADPIVNPGNEDSDSDPAAESKRYSEAYWAWARRGTAEIEPEQKRLLRRGAVGAAEMRAQGISTAAGGGFLVPEDFRNRLVETMKFFGSVITVAENITTSTGAVLPWPTNDDTANVGAILAENTVPTEQDVVLGETQLDSYTYTSKLTRVSWQLLQDDAFDLENWLPRKHGERIGRITNQHFTTGTGTSQPQGVQTASVIGKTGATGQTTTVTGDDLIDLVHSVDVAYRNERSRFMLHDLSLAKIRKLKDANNMYLWQPSVQAGTPDALLGHGIVVNNDMPQMAASTKSILFGDFFAGYVVRIVRGIQSVRLDERYADFLQSGFFSFARFDGKAQDTGAYRAYANSAT
jgi:HK97 family phage major capsid protein